MPRVKVRGLTKIFRAKIDPALRLGLDKDQPEAYAILNAFALSLDDEQKVMVWNNEAGADPAVTARKWVDENKDKVAAWK